MIAIDAQILVFAHRRETPWHDRARGCIAELVDTGTRWAIPVQCLAEFYAAATRRYGSAPAEAIDQIDAWREAPSLALLAEDAGTWPVLRALLRASRVSGLAVHDARIAAVCLQNGVTELWTQDRDFLRFPALRVRNPLVDIQPTGAREPRAPWLTRATPARAARPRRRGRGAARRR
jgi:toxin-antitoxin system PIN domain toxin